jgi:hypothetical protein
MLARASLLCVLTAIAGATACSSSPSSSPPPATEAPPPAYAAFSSYCTGTLLVEKDVLSPAGGGAWIGDGKTMVVPGTMFLVAVEFEQWQGYVIDGDGKPSKINADFAKGLTKGTDFSSDCAATGGSPSAFVSSGEVVLHAATLFPNQDLSGTACKLDPATKLTNYVFESKGTVAKLTAAELPAKCGFGTGYSADIEYATLVAK